MYSQSIFNWKTHDTWMSIQFVRSSEWESLYEIGHLTFQLLSQYFNNRVDWSALDITVYRCRSNRKMFIQSFIFIFNFLLVDCPTTIQQSYNPAVPVLESCSLTEPQYHSPVFLQSCSLTVLQSYSPTVLQSCSLTILHSYSPVVFSIYLCRLSRDMSNKKVSCEAKNNDINDPKTRTVTIQMNCQYTLWPSHFLISPSQWGPRVSRYCGRRPSSRRGPRSRSSARCVTQSFYQLWLWKKHDYREAIKEEKKGWNFPNGVRG